MAYTTKQDDFSGIEVMDESGQTVATITGCTPEFLSQSLAAAELVAAFKKLLAVTPTFITTGNAYNEAQTAARASIAKAESII